MNIWAALADAINDAPHVRPDNSITADEFAERTGHTPRYAHALLSRNAALRGVDYRTSSGKRGKCWVPK